MVVAVDMKGWPAASQLKSMRSYAIFILPFPPPPKIHSRIGNWIFFSESSAQFKIKNPENMALKNPEQELWPRRTLA